MAISSCEERMNIMFDTMKVAKKIRQTRIDQNMTQMDLADAMGVSYQAVSNWERGNSMPDISKLEDLCGVLNISVAELLGMESKETAAVNKVLREEAPLTMEELSEIAPMLPPLQMKEQVKKSSGKKFNIKALAEIAMFMEDDLLEELLEGIEVESLRELEPLAPFLDESVLDNLVRRTPADDYEGIAVLAPFLDEDTIDFLIKRCGETPDKKLLERLLPFLNEETVDHMAHSYVNKMDTAMLETLVPFMEDNTLDEVTDIYIRNGEVRKLTNLYPFMESKTMRKVAKALMASGDIDTMKEAAMFM